ncbi:Calcium homeostasis modulator protein 6 [Acropora cervicornis]|uniref:Calcium homeostasis modulator protein 6 n=1 Tax=Acropora cervicornis TaxID=6130 RepID=A0AAD9R5Z5_ACRCE|nr:Calcium homeostasis modulator protein 6 [Acropora cervicornis]
MALKLTSVINSVKSAFESHSGAIRNTTVALVVYGLNEIVKSKDFFRCPPKHFAIYASCFFVVPAVFLIVATIFLHSRFWDLVRGCCYYKSPYRRGVKKYLCFLYPRWPCSYALVEILIQSSVSGFLWIFWALLQRDYFICARLGGTKEAKLVNATFEERLKIEADYANTGRNSQMAALFLLGGALIVAFVVVSVYRCCFQPEFGSLPSPNQYQILEAEAAVQAFKENMEKLARGQGKRRADMYFATMNSKNSSDILKNAYEDLITVNKFDEAFPSLEDYEHLQAQAASAAFKERVQQEGKQKVELTFTDTTWREYEETDPFLLVASAHEAMAESY